MGKMSLKMWLKISIAQIAWKLFIWGSNTTEEIYWELIYNIERERKLSKQGSNCPSELEPVLAKIEHINSLGKSSWYEVVYFDEHWRCYAGSNTFKDGEKVVKWRYCKDCC